MEKTSKMNKTVTISISPNAHPLRIIAEIGDKIKLNRGSWGIAKQRIKNKQMIFRMLRKEYYPYFSVIHVNKKDDYTTTLTIKPYNL